MLQFCIIIIIIIVVIVIIIVIIIDFKHFEDFASTRHSEVGWQARGIKY